MWSTCFRRIISDCRQQNATSALLRQGHMRHVTLKTASSGKRSGSPTLGLLREAHLLQDLQRGVLAARLVAGDTHTAEGASTCSGGMGARQFLLAGRGGSSEHARGSGGGVPTATVRGRSETASAQRPQHRGGAAFGGAPFGGAPFGGGAPFSGGDEASFRQHSSPQLLFLYYFFHAEHWGVYYT